MARQLPAQPPNLTPVSSQYAAPAEPARYSPPALVPGLPYTRRALLTSICVHVELAIGVFIAQQAILPTRPHLLPLAIVLPVTISLCLHQVLRQPAQTAYDAALRRAAPTIEACVRCGFPRAERTHHCRECGRCTARMSHHCGVLGVCVGAHNYKPFVQLVAQGALGTTLLAWYASDVNAVLRLLGYYRRLAFPPLRLLVWLQMVYCQFVAAAALAFLAALHARLVALNVSVLEAWTREAAWHAITRPRFLVGGKPQRTPYDKGCCRNVREVFGDGLSGLAPVVDVERMVLVT